jgi:hypothetical protein
MAGDRHWLGAAILCYLVVLVATEGAINVPPANMFFWLFAGLLAGQAMTQLRDPTSQSGRPVTAKHLPRIEEAAPDATI